MVRLRFLSTTVSHVSFRPTARPKLVDPAAIQQRIDSVSLWSLTLHTVT